LPHFDRKQSVKWDKKRQMAAEAAKLIEDRDAVLLDGGSTTYKLACAGGAAFAGRTEFTAGRDAV